MVLWTVLEDESEKEESCPFVLTEFPCHEGRSTCNANCDPIRPRLAVFQLNSSQTVLSQPDIFTGKKKNKTTPKEPQTPQNLYKQANLKEDVTSVVFLPCNWAISKCHANGIFGKEGSLQEQVLSAQEILDMVMTDRKLLTSTHVLSEKSHHFSF